MYCILCSAILKKISLTPRCVYTDIVNFINCGSKVGLLQNNKYIIQLNYVCCPIIIQCSIYNSPCLIIIKTAHFTIHVYYITIKCVGKEYLPNIISIIGNKYITSNS